MDMQASQEDFVVCRQVDEWLMMRVCLPVWQVKENRQRRKGCALSGKRKKTFS